MKILFISAANSIHTVRWVNALQRRRNQITLVSLPNHREETQLIDKDIDIKYLPFGGTRGYYLNALALKNIYNDLKPDITNVHYASGYGTLARVAHLPNVLLSVWGSDVYDFPYESKIKMEILRKNLNYASMIASTSNSMAEQTKKLIGQREIAITPFGVDTNVFKKVESPDSHTFTIAFIKTLSPKYGVATVIRAFSIFAKKITTTSTPQLLIYGKGELLNELKELVEELHIKEQVHFLGYIENSKIPLVYSKVDVACFASELDSESFGVSAVEAMACEVPVVVTDVSGFREVVEDKVTGFVVKRNCPEELAEKLVELYESEDLRRQMGEAGRKRVKMLYNWDKNVDTMLETYHKMS